MSATRAEFLFQVLELHRLPYLWCGKGFTPAEATRLGLPIPTYDGRDCSGVVTCALRAAGGPDWRATHNADTLHDELAAPDAGAELPGDLCLYGTPGHGTHVMVLLALDLVIGASGGGSTTTTLTRALEQGASVRVHRRHLYRRDFIGFRRLPLAQEPRP